MHFCIALGGACRNTWTLERRYTTKGIIAIIWCASKIDNEDNIKNTVTEPENNPFYFENNFYTMFLANLYLRCPSVDKYLNKITKSEHQIFCVPAFADIMLHLQLPFYLYYQRYYVSNLKWTMNNLCYVNPVLTLIVFPGLCKMTYDLDSNSCTLFYLVNDKWICNKMTKVLERKNITSHIPLLQNIPMGRTLF